MIKNIFIVLRGVLYSLISTSLFSVAIVLIFGYNIDALKLGHVSNYILVIDIIGSGVLVFFISNYIGNLDRNNAVSNISWVIFLVISLSVYSIMRDKSIILPIWYLVSSIIFITISGVLSLFVHYKKFSIK
jgi:hypothetical protein